MLVTALVPHIGYSRAAGDRHRRRIATGIPLREAALALGPRRGRRLRPLGQPAAMARPHGAPAGAAETG